MVLGWKGLNGNLLSEAGREGLEKGDAVDVRRGAGTGPCRSRRRCRVRPLLAQHLPETARLGPGALIERIGSDLILNVGREGFEELAIELDRGLPRSRPSPSPSRGILA